MGQRQGKRKQGWFEVDSEHLGRLVDERGREFVVYELIQNAWDQRATEVVVSLAPIPGRKGLARLVVEDDDPNGFVDLTHAYTLYAPSAKLADPTRRGRFNRGEKLVLALCEEAEIRTTTGVVRFDTSGRHETTRGSRAQGTRFEASIRMTKPDIERVTAKVQLLIPPASISTTFNGTPLPSRAPAARIEVSLDTVVADDEGFLRHRTRRTSVDLYEPVAGEPARLYELGIPVVETGDTWDYNVLQKVPLNADRDNVTPGYLRALRLAVLNAMHDRLSVEDAKAPWVRQAAEDPDCTVTAITAVVEKRFGTNVVSHDPKDPDASVLATEAGSVVVHGSQLSKGEWANAKRAGIIRPASQVFPSHSALEFSADGEQVTPVPERDWSAGMRQVVTYCTDMGSKLIERPVTVEVVTAPRLPALAWYGDGRLTLNLGRLGRAWFERGIAEEVDALLLHELGHENGGRGHRGTAYYDALCRLGARLKRLSLP